LSSLTRDGQRWLILINRAVSVDDLADGHVA